MIFIFQKLFLAWLKRSRPLDIDLYGFLHLPRSCTEDDDAVCQVDCFVDLVGNKQHCFACSRQMRSNSNCMISQV